MFEHILSDTAKQSLDKLKEPQETYLKNLAAEKIAAIADRGAKRDFIDLYFILAREQILTLHETLELYDKKFGTLAQNKVYILKSLVYFDDAEQDAMPNMIHKVRWDSVKQFFFDEQKSLSKKLFS